MLLVLGALVALIVVAILSTARVFIHSTDLGSMSEQWLAEHRASSHFS